MPTTTASTSSIVDDEAKLASSKNNGARVFVYEPKSVRLSSSSFFSSSTNTATAASSSSCASTSMDIRRSNSEDTPAPKSMPTIMAARPRSQSLVSLTQRATSLLKLRPNADGAVKTKQSDGARQRASERAELRRQAQVWQAADEDDRQTLIPVDSTGPTTEASGNCAAAGDRPIDSTNASSPSVSNDCRVLVAVNGETNASNFGPRSERRDSLPLCAWDSAEANVLEAYLDSLLATLPDFDAASEAFRLLQLDACGIEPPVGESTTCQDTDRKAGVAIIGSTHETEEAELARGGGGEEVLYVGKAKDEVDCDFQGNGDSDATAKPTEISLPDEQDAPDGFLGSLLCGPRRPSLSSTGSEPTGAEEFCYLRMRALPQLCPATVPLPGGRFRDPRRSTLSSTGSEPVGAEEFRFLRIRDLPPPCPTTEYSLPTSKPAANPSNPPAPLMRTASTTPLQTALPAAATAAKPSVQRASTLLVTSGNAKLNNPQPRDSVSVSSDVGRHRWRLPRRRRSYAMNNNNNDDATLATPLENASRRLTVRRRGSRCHAGAALSDWEVARAAPVLVSAKLQPHTPPPLQPLQQELSLSRAVVFHPPTQLQRANHLVNYLNSAGQPACRWSQLPADNNPRQLQSKPKTSFASRLWRSKTETAKSLTHTLNACCRDWHLAVLLLPPSVASQSASATNVDAQFCRRLRLRLSAMKPPRLPAGLLLVVPTATASPLENAAGVDWTTAAGAATQVLTVADAAAVASDPPDAVCCEAVLDAARLAAALAASHRLL